MPLEPRKLRALLETHGEYPGRYRLLVWERLAGLPRNGLPYGHLAAKGPHPALADLETRVPLASAALGKRLSAALSALAHWCPLFAEAAFLPALAFPFVRLMGADGHATFEMLATLLLSQAEGWCARAPPRRARAPAALPLRTPRLLPLRCALCERGPDFHKKMDSDSSKTLKHCRR